MSNDPQRTTDDNVSPYAGSVDATSSLQPGQSTKPARLAEAAGLPTIAGYEVFAEIAKGGMGRVVLGRELALDREVAIKVLLPGANAERFISESKITARLPHPSIPPIYALGTSSDGSPYLAMKFVRGRTLADELRSRPNPLHELPRFVQIFEQIAHAVGFAHARNIIHRDLKPANIMLGAFGEVQVMDWGLAKEIRAAEKQTDAAETPAESDRRSSELTLAGSVMGTPAYMAPEQARGEAADARADVFALGGILCHMLTGREVHSGHSLSETIQNAAAGQTDEALRRLDSSGADAELVAIARSCLAAEREQRPVDGQAVAASIAAYRQGVEQRLHKAETERAAALVREAEQLKRRRQFFRLGAAVAVVLVLGIAGTGAGLVRANRAAEAERAAKEHAVEQQKKAEARLSLIRATINQFTSDLPGIGEHLPLSKALRQELLEVSRKLVTSIRDENDLNDTYNYGTYALAMKDSQNAQARGDAAEARKKAVEARDGFQRILDSRPQMLDRAKNNLAIALAQLGQLDTADKKYPEAEANCQQAVALRRDILAEPHGDIDRDDVELSLAMTLTQFGGLETQRKHYESAAAQLREADAIYQRLLKNRRDLRQYMNTRLNWVHNQMALAALAHWEGVQEGDLGLARKRVVAFYVRVIDQLQADVDAMPESAGLHAALAKQAGYLGRYYLECFKDYKHALQYSELAVRHRRWFWDGKEISSLGYDLGSNYYELGLFADKDRKPELARRYFGYCLHLWQLSIDELEVKGEPADSKLFVDKKITQMLAQGRLGMHREASQTAAQLLQLASRDGLSTQLRLDYTAQAAVGFGMSAVAFSPGSPERADYFRKAMAALRQCVAYGWKNWSYLETDEDFDPLREWPEFQRAIDEWKARDAKGK